MSGGGARPRPPATGAERQVRHPAIGANGQTVEFMVILPIFTTYPSCVIK